MSTAVNPDLPDALPLYGVQLVDTYLLDAQVSRRPKTDEDEDGPTLEASQGPSLASEDEKTLDASISVKLAVPYRDGEYRLEILCSVTGRFVSTEPKTSTFWDAFAGREALAVLWPYLRASVGELGRMTGLRVPMLPTLDVKAIVPTPRLTPEPGPDAPKGRAPRRKAAAAAIG